MADIEKPPNSSSSGESGNGASNDTGNTLQRQESSRQDTTGANKDDDVTEEPLHQVKSLGKLKFRPDDDDEPQDWWFASTAIPLIAATVGPMANVMSIAALVTSWRMNLTDTGPEQDEDAIGFPDPHWCIAVNIASLVCGFLGNLFLLFNFTKAIRYIVALPMTIIMWYFATGMLTGILISLNKYAPAGPGQVYSQGFWHAVIASCLYMFCAMILMVNMLGYFLGHYPQHFALTDDQRNLILQTMMFFIWLAGGAAVFADVEGWSYCDALYFADVTILTVGFGDFYPTTDASRGLVFPYSVGGIIILGLMVSSIHRFANEISRDNVIKGHAERRRVNTISRVVTTEEELRRKQEDLERQLDLRPGHRPPISGPLSADGTPPSLNVNTVDFDQSNPKPSQFMNSPHHKGPLHATIKAVRARGQTIRRARTRPPKLLLMKEEKDRFDAMRKIQAQTSKFKRWYALTLSVTAFGILWCVGAIVFWQAERGTQDLSYFQALYFCYVSLLTIGYGDLSPKSNAGKPFFIVWSLIAIPTMTILISDMGDTVVASFKQGTFRLADWTVLPKEGIYRQFLDRNPWLVRIIQSKAEKRRIQAGFQIEETVQTPTLEQLATKDNLTEAELSRQLAFAIRKTADDLRHGNKQRYSYEEWVEFTRLIKFTTESTDQMEYNEEENGVVDWDWIGESSPMLSDQSEPEWVLDRLCESLMRYLTKSHDNTRIAEFTKKSQWDGGVGERVEIRDTAYASGAEGVEEESVTVQERGRDTTSRDSRSSRHIDTTEHVSFLPQLPQMQSPMSDTRTDLDLESRQRRRDSSQWSARGERRRASYAAAHAGGGGGGAISPMTPTTHARRGPFRVLSHGGRGGVGNRRQIPTPTTPVTGAFHAGYRNMKRKLKHGHTIHRT